MNHKTQTVLSPGTWWKCLRRRWPWMLNICHLCKSGLLMLGSCLLFTKHVFNNVWVNYCWLICQTSLFWSLTGKSSPRGATQKIVIPYLMFLVKCGICQFSLWLNPKETCCKLLLCLQLSIINLFGWCFSYPWSIQLLQAVLSFTSCLVAQCCYRCWSHSSTKSETDSVWSRGDMLQALVMVADGLEITI